MDQALAIHPMLILLNLGFAAVALAIGFAAGAWFLGGRAGVSPEEQAAADKQRLEQHLAFERAALASSRLKDLAGGVACDVGEHSTRVEEITQHLRDAQNAPLEQQTAEVAAAVAQIVEANETLQTKLTKAEEQIQAQAEEIRSHQSEARTDSLTGLANRRAFDDHISQRFAEWRRNQTPFSLILLDVDHFKKFNDNHGHQAGDEVLRHVAATLEAVVREVDVCCRYGGEEFAVVLPATQAQDAMGLIERLRRGVERLEVPFEAKRLRVTASFGLAETSEADDKLRLIRRADEALYAAKGAGRNRCFWNQGKRCLPVPGGRRAKPSPPPSGKPSPNRVLDGLPNRTRFTDALRQRLAEIERSGAPLAVMAIDVRGYEPLRQQHGDAVAQMTLDSLAVFLRKSLREMDLIGRLDEARFVIMLPTAGLDEAHTVAQRTAHALARCAVPVGEAVLKLHPVLGVAAAGPGDTAATLIGRADAALEERPVGAITLG